MRDEDSAALPPSGRVALLESDPELTAMLSWATARIGLQWNPPPCPERLWLEVWFLWAGHAEKQHPAPVPFFLEVHQRTQSCGTHLFLPETAPLPPLLLTTLDGGPVKE